MNPTLTPMRHTAAQILSNVVCELFPGVQLIAAAAHEWGFYCDFLAQQSIDAHILPLIEERMRAALKGSSVIHVCEMMRENAVTLFEHRHQPIKALLVAHASENIVPVWQIDDFFDFNPGPHVAALAEIGPVKLFDVASRSIYLPEFGQLLALRIEGSVFADKSSLKRFVKKREAAKASDHQRLGKEGQLFEFHSDSSTLTPWGWLPRGEFLRAALRRFWEAEHVNQRFQFLTTPSLWSAAFLKSHPELALRQRVISDCEAEGVDYALMPPGAPAYRHAAAFAAEARASWQLPLRYAEIGESYFNTPSSASVGLFRTAVATADNAHLFCTAGQLPGELISSLQFIHKIITIVAFEWRCYLLVRQPKKNSLWQESLDQLKEALNCAGVPYELDFSSWVASGPQIEFRICDSLGREWLGPSLQINLRLPEQLGLHYHAESGALKKPKLLVRKAFNNLEAFIALLLEKGGGWLPFWLAPEQIRLIAVEFAQLAYAQSIERALIQEGFRVGLRVAQGSLAAEVHSAEHLRVPYVLILGRQEQDKGDLSVRVCGRQQKNAHMSMKAFLDLVDKANEL